MRKMFICLMLVSFLFTTTGCFVHNHKIGQPSTGVKEEKYQWYLAWGIFPVGDEVDGGAMAGKKDVKITSKFDWLGIVTGFFSAGIASCRLVTVEK